MTLALYTPTSWWIMAGLYVLIWVIYTLRSNWWRSKPWQWHYKNIYRSHRDDLGYGRLRSIWYSARFPHVHDNDEI